MLEGIGDARDILPEKPFERGMATAFDLYGLTERRMNERIWQHWRRLVDQPRKTADEALREDLRLVSSQYRNLLEEQEK